MKIHLYALCWNEEKMLPFFFNHYSPICDKIIILDNGSTDKSHEFIKSNPKAELRPYESNGQIRDDIYIELKNNVWKEDRTADWIIVVDIDEFIVAKNMRHRLQELKDLGYTLIHPGGRDMISKTFDFTQTDRQIYDILQNGISVPGKPCIFSPSELQDINYTAGAHTAAPIGNIKTYTGADVRWLHYKNIDVDYVLTRNKQFGARLSDFNRKSGFGSHYLLDDLKITNYIEAGITHGTNVVSDLLP